MLMANSKPFVVKSATSLVATAPKPATGLVATGVTNVLANTRPNADVNGNQGSRNIEESNEFPTIQEYPTVLSTIMERSDESRTLSSTISNYSTKTFSSNSSTRASLGSTTSTSSTLSCDKNLLIKPNLENINETTAEEVEFEVFKDKPKEDDVDIEYENKERNPPNKLLEPEKVAPVADEWGDLMSDMLMSAQGSLKWGAHSGETFKSGGAHEDMNCGTATFKVPESLPKTMNKKPEESFPVFNGSKQSTLSCKEVENPFDEEVIAKILKSVSPPISSRAGFCFLDKNMPSMKLQSQITLGKELFNIRRQLGQGECWFAEHSNAN